MRTLAKERDHARKTEVAKAKKRQMKFTISPKSQILNLQNQLNTLMSGHQLRSQKRKSLLPKKVSKNLQSNLKHLQPKVMMEIQVHLRNHQNPRQMKKKT